MGYDIHPDHQGTSAPAPEYSNRLGQRRTLGEIDRKAGCKVSSRAVLAEIVAEEETENEQHKQEHDGQEPGASENIAERRGVAPNLLTAEALEALNEGNTATNNRARPGFETHEDPEESLPEASIEHLDDENELGNITLALGLDADAPQYRHIETIL
jgi:pyruvate/2-oxoglutarate dehydrogenase complex dihydrolipoamide acyltransferase (E2) component